jgi:tRNA(fMet)-specific endonuclease VapC
VSRLLLDTTFLIDSERNSDELEDVIHDDDDVAIAAITVAELRVGALRATGRRAEARTAFVEDVVASIPVLDYNIDVAEAHARLLTEVRAQGKPRGAHDLIIAATARSSDRTIVTADSTAFVDLTGLAVRMHR